MSSVPIIGAHQLNPPENAVEQYGNIIRLKSMLQQQQMQKLQMQGEELQNESRQHALNDQNAQTAAMKEWDGKDWNAYPGLIIKHGGSAQAVLQAKQGIIAYQGEVAKMNKAQLENEATRNNYFAQALDNVKQLPPDQQAAAFEGAKAQAVQDGHLDPQKAQSLQYQGPEQLAAMEKLFIGHSEAVKQQLEGQQTLEAGARAGEANAQADKIRAETQGLTGPLAESKYRNILTALAAHKPVPEADLEFAHGYELANRKTTTSSDSLGVTSSNTSGPSGLAAAGRKTGTTSAPGGAPAAGSPSQQSTKDSLVDLFGQYKANPTMLQRMIVKHPDILAAVQQKYPDFDQTTYNAKNKLIMGYTSGPQSKEINAINTVAGHLDTLDSAVAALNNDDVTLLNKIGNKIGVNVTGQTAASAFKTILHRVGPEITTAYVQGGGGEGERIANAEDFSENLPPQTLHNNIGVTVGLLRSKIGALENQYKQAVGRDDFQQRFITSAAQSSFAKLGGEQGKPGAGKVIHYKIVNGQLVAQ